MRRVKRTEASHAVKSGYSYEECDLDGSEPWGVHSIEENVGGVLWDAIVRGERSPSLGFRLERIQKFGCGGCVFVPKRQRVSWQSRCSKALQACWQECLGTQGRVR